MAATQEEIKAWFAANQGASDVQIAQAMKQAGVGTFQVAQANGTPLDEVDRRYNAAMGLDEWDNRMKPGSMPGSQPTQDSTNLGMGSSNQGGSTSGSQPGYNQQQNPYLSQIGADIGSQMSANWSRNIMPSIGSGAMAVGGYGGSRQGVVEANGLNDMNNQYGQALTSMYGQDWTNQQNRNLTQQSQNNSYDLGLRSSDLSYANLDANIANNNFINQLASANFGMNAYNTLNSQTQAGITAGTNVQNTPLDYQKYFTNSASGVGSGFASNTNSQTNSGNPYMGAIGGAMLGNQFQNAYTQG